MDKIELIAIAIGLAVIAVAVAVVLIFPALGGDYRKSTDPRGGDSGG
ncbi:hypothetical protein [Phenylobacterium sp.]|nr:hypothetical protein [Phenylobacterium sp.]MBX3484091.1 hypothetical protein [Phenylobacterium sp.]MCW5760558.1 hypothetical protein [Phenylobacterium sp.]